MAWDPLAGSTVAQLDLNLTADQVRWIDAVLANDEVSTEEELREYLIENGVTAEQAEAVLRARFDHADQKQQFDYCECGRDWEDCASREFADDDPEAVCMDRDEYLRSGKPKWMTEDEHETEAPE